MTKTNTSVDYIQYHILITQDNTHCVIYQSVTDWFGLGLDSVSPPIGLGLVLVLVCSGLGLVLVFACSGLGHDSVSG